MKKQFLKKLMVSLLVTSVVWGTAACGSGQENGSSGDTAGSDSSEAAADTTDKKMLSESEETVKLVFLKAGTEENKKEAFSKLLEEFQEEYPNIEVEYQEAPWGNDFETKLNTGFASGTAPDVINYSLASIGSRVPLGQYECLDSYVEGWDGLDDYYESILNAGSVGGKLYGIGNLTDARMLAYNTELFEEAGLDPDTPPTTWEELLEYHKKLVKKDDNGNVIQTGLGVPTNGSNINQWLEIFAAQNGVKNLVDEGTNEILFNTPETIEAMEFLNKLNDAGLVSWDMAQSDQDPFRNGTAAMSIINSDGFKAVNTGELEGKIKMAPMFTGKQKATFCGVHFMFMNADSPNKDAAWKLIEFLTRKESLQKYCEIVGIAPVRASLEDWYMENGGENAAFVMEGISIGQGSPKVPYYQTVFNYVDEAMEKIFYGESGVEDALNEAAEKLQEEINNQ